MSAPRRGLVPRARRCEAPRQGLACGLVVVFVQGASAMAGCAGPAESRADEDRVEPSPAPVEPDPSSRRRRQGYARALPSRSADRADPEPVDSDACAATARADAARQRCRDAGLPRRDASAPDASPSSDAPDLDASTKLAALPDARPADSGASPDSGVPAPATSDPCVGAPFDEPEPLTGLEVNAELFAPSLAPDGRRLYFAANVTGFGEDVFVAERSERGTAFSAATPVAAVNVVGDDGTPFVAENGLELWMHSSRPGGEGDRDVWVSRRSDLDGEFGLPQRVGAASTPSLDHLPTLSPDGLVLSWVSTRPGGLGQSDVWTATRASEAADFGGPRPLAEINTSEDEGRAQVSRDGLRLYFSSTRAGGLGAMDLWLATRDGADEPFSEPRPLTELNSDAHDRDVAVAADEREVLFSSSRNGRNRLWRALRRCGNRDD